MTAGSREGKLFIRIIHKRQVKEIPTSFVVKTYEWEERAGKIVYKDAAPSRNGYLARVEEKMSSALACLHGIEGDLIAAGATYTASDLAEGFRALSHADGSMIAFCEKVAAELIDNGQVRTARAYRSAVRSLRRFRGDSNLHFGDITSGAMRSYEEYLRGQGLEKNSISFYMRNLRALYYRAIDEKVIRPQPENPFTHVYTGVSVSRKRALDVKEIGELRRVQEKISEALATEQSVRRRRKMERIRDALLYFDFCLEARGMSWVDMTYLRKDALGENTFTYRRRKTKGELEIIVTPAMKKIISHFARRTEGSPYVFPVIRPGRGSELRQYESGLRIQNERLAIAARMAGLEKGVTTHVSRHSWATIAKREKIDISMISELLGHSDVRTTSRYLASFERSDVAKATEQVVRALRKA